MTSMVFLIDIVFFYDINGFSHRYLLSHQWFCPYISYFYMTSTCFPHRYRICIWHQWFFPQISYQTLMVFHRDIVYLYGINGFAHRYRIFSGHPWFCRRYRIFIWHQWFFPYISFKTSMVLPVYIIFLYDINGFSHIYLLRHQWFWPYISYFYMTSTCFPHRYRIFIWHPLVFPIDVVSLWHQWFFTQISYNTSMDFYRDIVILYDINDSAHRYRIIIGHQWFFQ